MDAADVVRRVVDGEALGDAVRRLVEATDSSFAAALDSVAVEIAQRFLAGTLDYETADDCANALWTFMCFESPRTSDGYATIPDLAYAIFSAFDEGEYDHAGSTDPVQTFTVPQLRELLSLDGDQRP